jgi:predicted transcriptional regulator
MKDKIIIDENGLFICPICEKSFRGLVYHTRQKHKLSARDLRKQFNLPMNYSLQTPELKQRRKDKALENKMDLQLMNAGQKTRFCKGFKESEESRELKSIGHKINIRLITKTNI